MDYWKEFYPDGEEAYTRKKLEPLGKPVSVWVYMDEKHAGNLENMISHSGILIYVNKALINFYSKRKNTVESLSFGSDFVVLGKDTEMVVSLRYKLRTFGVHLEGTSKIYRDKKSVMTNSSVTVSALIK